MMSVPRPGHGGGGIVQTADHMDIPAEWGKRRKARRHPIVRPGFRWNPIPLGNAITIEPEEEAVFDFVFVQAGSIRCSVSVEHRNERRQSHTDTGTRQREALQKSAPR